MKSFLLYLGNLLTAILRTIFMSAVLFLITYCIVTREFPPNFTKMKKSWAQVQRLTELSKAALQPESSAGFSDQAEREVQKLTQLEKAQAEIFTGEVEDISALRNENKRLQENLKSVERDLMFANQKILGLQDRMDALEKRVR